jgi:hypothetical protein
MSSKCKVGRPKGTGGKRKTDAAKIRSILENRGVDYPTDKVANIAVSRGVERNKALPVKICIERRNLREAA